MFKQSLLCLLGVALGYTGGMAAIGHSQEKAERSRVTLDLGVGDSNYHKPPDGVWVQYEYEGKPLQHSQRMQDNVKSAGFSWKANEYWTFGLHYAQLGSASINASIIACPEDDCSLRNAALDPNRKDCKDAYDTHTCGYRFISAGSARGALLTAAYRLFNLGDLGLDVRGGAYIHQVKWNAVIENYECIDDPKCWRVTINQRSSYGVKPVYGFGLKYEPAWLKGGFAQLTWDRFTDIGKHIDVTAGFKGDVDRTMVWVGLPLSL